MNIEYTSKENQDKIAYAFFSDKGFFLDIGSGHPKRLSNTWSLEKMGWEGLLFDIEPLHQGPSFKKWIEKRKSSRFFRLDTTSQEFVKILSQNSPPIVDYVSLDVDEASEKTLENFLSSGIRFKFMTLEHNSYDNPAFRDSSRKLLKEKGYSLLFGDVLSGSKNGSDKVFERWVRLNGIAIEDWWVNLNFFNKNVLNNRKDEIFSEECFFRLFNVPPEDISTSRQPHEYLL